MKIPSSIQELIGAAQEFQEEWNYRHCSGAIDGKRMIECRSNAGSAYFSYKNYHSIVFLVVCDAKYYFTFLDIGDYGGTNGASVQSNSAF